jgi:hypothetical protein
MRLALFLFGGRHKATPGDETDDPRRREELTTTAQQFVEHYGITPRFFVSRCLLPSLLAVRRASFFYYGVLVETHEFPAWNVRLRALRTVLAIGDAPEIEQKHLRIPFSCLRPAQLHTIADGFLETDCDRINADFLVAKCLLPAIEAVNTALLFYRGRLVDSLSIQDSATQLEALKIALRLHRVYRDESDNTHFATYRDVALLVSEGERMSRAIQIVRRSQLVYLR